MISAPGDSCVIRYYITGTGDSAGLLRLDATVSGTHALAGALVGHNTTSDTTALETVTVLTPAALSVTRVATATDTVTRGQTGGDSVLVTMQVHNSGQAPAINLGDTLTFWRGGANVSDSYAAVMVSEPATIAGGETGTFTYRVSVAANAETGYVMLDGSCTGTDSNASNIVSADSRAAQADTFLVQSPANLVVNSVFCDTYTVHQGLGGYAVRMTVTNLGEAIADFTDSGLWFRRAAGDTNVSESYTVAFAGGAASVAGGGTVTLNFTVDIAGGAETGAVYLDGYCTGADRNWPGYRTADTTAVPDTDIWDVQGAGALEIVSVTAALDTVSRGQTTLRVVLVFRNSGIGIITGGFSGVVIYNIAKLVLRRKK